MARPGRNIEQALLRQLSVFQGSFDLSAATAVAGTVPIRTADLLAPDPAADPLAGCEVVVVATPAVEPALAAVAADCLGRLDREPIVVLNRTSPRQTEPSRWDGHARHVLPESRMGAQLALSGREPRGSLGRAISELADRCYFAATVR